VPAPEEVNRVETEFAEEPAGEEERDPMIRVDTSAIVFPAQDDNPLEEVAEKFFLVGVR
jgi:hypothetical protein